jgi:hypothetical protein
MFSDNGWLFVFGIVVLYLEFVEEKCLQSRSSEAFKIKKGDGVWGKHYNNEELRMSSFVFLLICGVK